MKSKSVSLQKVLRDLEPRKGEMEDLDGRIKALQARVDEQTAKDKDYKEFYRGVDLVRTDIECFIPTARCHLELKDFQKRCVCAAIERVDKRIAKAKQEAEHARIRARWAERHHKNAKAKLEWAQKYWDFIEKDLRERIKKVKEQLVDLKGKVDPNQDQCIAYFYLYELERLIKTCGGDDRCWDPLIGVGNFLDCWDPDCYTRARNRMLAEFNDAAATEKLRESELKQADQLAADLKTQYETAESKRQDNILAEIAADDCCAKCPPASKEGAGREAR